MDILFTIIMPTYNSERTIERSLKSIRMQTIPQEQVEILVIDGESTDNTIEIAKEYGAVVLQNEKRLPEYAKVIGLKHAKGKYIVKMDSDEEFTNEKQLQKRLDFLQMNLDVKLLIADRLISGDRLGVASDYINAYGDPFTFFVYKSKESKILSFKKNIEENRDNYVLKFNDGNILPIADAGTTTIERKYIVENFSEFIDDIRFSCSMSEFIIAKSHRCGVLEGDDIVHNSGATLRTYIKKLKFRVINNVYSKSESGFSNREGMSSLLKKRKILFVLYAMSLVFPLIDGVKLMVKHKDVSFFLHTFYVYVVLFCIVFYMILKILGKQITNNQYGG